MSRGMRPPIAFPERDATQIPGTLPKAPIALDRRHWTYEQRGLRSLLIGGPAEPATQCLCALEHRSRQRRVDRRPAAPAEAPRPLPVGRRLLPAQSHGTLVAAGGEPAVRRRRPGRRAPEGALPS